MAKEQIFYAHFVYIPRPLFIFYVYDFSHKEHIIYMWN